MPDWVDAINQMKQGGAGLSRTLLSNAFHHLAACVRMRLDYGDELIERQDGRPKRFFGVRLVWL
jgi:hypothetical protein